MISKSRTCFVAALAAAAGSVFLHSGIASALVVLPANGGDLISGTVYYAATVLGQGGDNPANSDHSYVDQGPTNQSFLYRIFDLSQSVATETSGQRVNMLLFDLSQYGQQPVTFSASATPSSGGTAKFLPIAAVNQYPDTDASLANYIDCTVAGNPICGTATTLPTTGVNYFYQIPVAQSHIRVGIYISDVCNSFQNNGPAAQLTICKGNLVAPLVKGTVVPLLVSFSMTGAAATPPTTPVGGTPSPTPTAGSAASSSISLSFQADAPVLNCGPDYSNIYFPGDSQINLSSFGFSLLNPAGGTAPATNLVVFAKDTLNRADLPVFPVGAGGQPTNYTIYTKEGINSTQNFGGFINTTDGTDHKYQLVFGVRDASGQVAFGNPKSVTNPQNPCVLNDVQTSQIQGFLAQKKCFIATAAFRSFDAAPVELLRSFRDRILLRGKWGRSFVRNYYRLAPPAAEWLMDHPAFRFPILLYLIPIEILAWFMLNPVFLVMMLLFSIGAIWGILQKNSLNSGAS